MVLLIIALLLVDIMMKKDRPINLQDTVVIVEAEVENGSEKKKEIENGVVAIEIVLRVRIVTRAPRDIAAVEEAAVVVEIDIVNDT